MNNCVGNNNHRHFVFYVLFLELGVLTWARLVIACTFLVSLYHNQILNMPDLETIDVSKDAECSVLADDLCGILNKDPFTIIITIFVTFQLTWVSMLLAVQLIQVARNLTTYESMRGHLNSYTPAEALNSFVTTGDTSQDVAGGTGAANSNGFGSGQDIGEGVRPRQPKPSIWDQWKRLLGLDTFFATALQGSQAAEARNRGNPFSRGVITNCKDFFCDGAPVFKGKESGYARLGGERVDYTRMYEVPKMRYQRGGGQYESVAAEADV